MSWSIGYDSNWQRDIGYGVPAYCDHPKCSKEIDRRQFVDLVRKFRTAKQEDPK